MVFVVVAFLSRKSAKGWHMPVLVVSGLGALGLCVFDGVQRVRKESIQSKRGRALAESRQRVLAEYVAQKCAEIGGTSPLYFKNATRPDGAPTEEGLRKVFGDQLTVYTGGSETFDMATTEEVFRFTTADLLAVRDTGEHDVYIFSDIPGPQLTRLLLRRVAKRRSVVFLNVPSEERARNMVERGLAMAVVSKPPDQQASEITGNISKDLERAFEGEFTLYTP